MSLNRVIADLEKGLDMLKAMNSTLPERVIPPQGITLPDAFARLLAAIPKARNLSIYPPEIKWAHYHKDRLELDKWRIWDGHSFTEADTLLLAVEKVEKDNRAPEDQAADAAAILDSLTIQDEPTAPLPPVDEALKEPSF